jgi:hypothetical protein
MFAPIVRAGEVDAGEVAVRERHPAHLGAVAEDEVDHARRQACLLEHLQDRPGAQLGLLGRLPEHDVPHHGRRVGQVGEAQEVERGDREHEPLERPVLHPVPRARQRLRLHLVHLAHVADVELEVVRGLAGRVDLGLAHRLRQVQHGDGVQPGPPGAAGELGRTQEDRRPVFPRHPRPVLPRLGRGDDGRLDLAGPGPVGLRQRALVVVRDDDGVQAAGLDVAAADAQRQLGRRRLDAGELRIDGGALGRARRVVERLLVAGRGEREEGGCGGQSGSSGGAVA